MKIVVYVKQVPDPTIVKFDLGTGTLENVFYVMNPYDKLAAEEAIRIREQFGGEVTAITFGPPRANEALRECLTMGADGAIRVWSDNLGDLDAYGVSLVLSRATASVCHDYDLILCGRKSIDTADEFVGPCVAELLCLPCVTAVTKTEVYPDKGEIIVQRRLAKGDREVFGCPLPALLTVDEGLNDPRYPSLPVYIAGLRKKIVELEAKSLIMKLEDIKPKIKIVTLSQSRPRLKRARIDTSLSPWERTELIMTGGVKEKGAEVVAGQPPEVLASKIIHFLKEET